MDSLPEIVKQALLLFKESWAECCRVRDAIPKPDKNNQDEVNRTGIAKKNLIDSAQLAGQIIRALDSKSLLLALIGLRSLTESLINTVYAFTHPKHKGDLGWTYKICKDYFDRGNDPLAPKSQLNDKSIAARARDAELSEHYQKTFTGLCNYTHMLVHTTLPNDPQRFEEFTRQALVNALTTLHDIRAAIQEHFKIDGSKDHEKKIIEFHDKYNIRE